MRFQRGFQPARIRHRLDIYKATRLPRDARWVEAWLRYAPQARFAKSRHFDE